MSSVPKIINLFVGFWLFVCMKTLCFKIVVTNVKFVVKSLVKWCQFLFQIGHFTDHKKYANWCIYWLSEFVVSVSDLYEDPPWFHCTEGSSEQVTPVWPLIHVHVYMYFFCYMYVHVHVYCIYLASQSVTLICIRVLLRCSDRIANVCQSSSSCWILMVCEPTNNLLRDTLLVGDSGRYYVGERCCLGRKLF